MCAKLQNLFEVQGVLVFAPPRKVTYVPAISRKQNNTAAPLGATAF
jgi:hypothetical protein